MRMKDKINVKGILKIYEDDKLIYMTKNTIDNGLDIIGNQMSSFSGINNCIDHHLYGSFETWNTGYGFIPTAILATDNTHYLWMPIMSYNSSGGVVTYQAKMYPSEYSGYTVSTVKLGESTYWNHLDFIVQKSSSNHEKIRTADTPTYLTSDKFLGQPSLVYGTFNANSLGARVYILQQEYGFLTGVTGDANYRIYDDGVGYWKVECGKAIDDMNGANGQLICNGVIHSRTVSDSYMNIFSYAGVTGGVVHNPNKTLLFVWQIIYS